LLFSSKKSGYCFFSYNEYESLALVVIVVVKSITKINNKPLVNILFLPCSIHFIYSTLINITLAIYLYSYVDEKLNTCYNDIYYCIEPASISFWQTNPNVRTFLGIHPITVSARLHSIQNVNRFVHIIDALIVVTCDFQRVGSATHTMVARSWALNGPNFVSVLFTIRTVVTGVEPIYWTHEAGFFAAGVVPWYLEI